MRPNFHTGQQRDIFLQMWSQKGPAGFMDEDPSHPTPLMTSADPVPCCFCGLRPQQLGNLHELQNRFDPAGLVPGWAQLLPRSMTWMSENLHRHPGIFRQFSGLFLSSRHLPGCLISRYFMMDLASSGGHMVLVTIMDYFSIRAYLMPKLSRDLLIGSLLRIPAWKRLSKCVCFLVVAWLFGCWTN